MKFKKAAGWPIRVLIVAGLLFLFAVVYWAFYGPNLREASQFFSKQLDNIKNDCDQDHAPDGVDSCPCKKGDLGNDGCPLGYTITKTGTGYEDRLCLKQCPSKTT